ncbi:oxidoreductase [Auraticoccus monumenti]|uniref:Predicted oxidoreductase n=1 Tax=Auraticoccus monumenti TaxID=675864 RepID=A0A1G6T7C2_9ACTN|nr:oxidoreductase [Auraticoccus monumenti]SDD24929.1 Predicted oxidoreductase [Auraticoccus monumenti]
MTPNSTFTLGSTSVHRIGYGTMQLPGPHVMGPPRDHDEAVRVLRRAVELGVDHIDTAQFYGPDVANELIAEALHPYPDGLALVTKVGARRDEAGAWVPDPEPASLRTQVEQNLRTLGTDRLTAVNLRLMEQPRPALEDQLAELVSLRDEGLIGGIGLSNADSDEVRSALGAGLVCVQNAYSLVDRSSEDVLDLCTAEGIAFVPFFPLGSAIPGMPKVTDLPDVRSVAERLGATPAQVGLAWLLARAENVLLIPGTSSVAHLEENVAAGGLTLSDEDLATLVGL